MHRYILYARKSSETEDRQENSITDQVTGMEEVGIRRNLEVITTITDQKTAHKPGVREGFSQMITLLKEGKADAILTYNTNRLSRNPQESGIIQQLLQDGIIQEIVTAHRVYEPKDNAFIFGVEGLIANQFSRDLSAVVKDRLELKARRGDFPHMAPIGYMNDRNSKTIIPDPDTFPYVQTIWRLALEGMSLRKIAKQMESSGFQTKKKRYRGGKLILPSAIRWILHNIFYTGMFLHNGTLYQGNHQAMVSMEEFETVQRLQEGPSKPRGKGFRFSGMGSCALCGCAVTAERRQRTMADGSHKEYIFYHCTNSKGICRAECVNEAAITQELLSVAQGLEIPLEFIEWGREICERWQGEAQENRETIYENHRKNADQVEKQLDTLLNMRLSQELTPEEYTRKKESLNIELTSIRKHMKLAEEQSDTGRTRIENALDLLERAAKQLQGGEEETIRQLAQDLCGNFILRGKHIEFEKNTDSLAVRFAFEKLVRETESFEPIEIGSGEQKNTLSGASRSVWWAILDDLRHSFLQEMEMV